MSDNVCRLTSDNSDRLTGDTSYRLTKLEIVKADFQKLLEWRVGILVLERSSKKEPKQELATANKSQ